METRPTKETPSLISSTSSTTSAPPWSPCPSYKPYRPSPPPADPNSPNVRVSTTTTNLNNMNSSSSTTNAAAPAAAATAPRALPDPSILPTGKKSLAGISLRAFGLGQVAGLSLLATIQLLLDSKNAYAPLWRAPFFLTTLSTFHFLEFYTTARYNTSYVTVSAFLLSTNGLAYNLAHTSALTECILSRLFLSPTSRYFTIPASLVGGVSAQVGLGLLLMVLGQTVRSLAMVQAGANFTHTIQRRKREDHVLVTSGVYSVLRHPSYFGFFWWGLGTQLVLGNVVCFVGYAVVLWSFFAERIKREEELLIKFFGDDYVEYRKKTRVGIPGIS